MEANTTFNARGSFGVPEHLIRQPMKEESKPAPETVKASPSVEAPVAENADVVQPTQEESKSAAQAAKSEEKDIESLRKFWEDRLRVTITEKDVREYIFKGRLIKDGIEVIPGYMRATFQSVNAEELSQIDQRMADFREAGRYTADGLQNENALQVLSHGWLRSVEVEGDVSKPSKSMGNTPEDRYKTISKISALAVQEAIEAWDGFNLLLKIALREKRLLKKY